MTPLKATRAEAKRWERNLNRLETKMNTAKKKASPNQKPIYYIREERGRFYVYRLEYAPVETLFDIKQTREEAEQAIKDHKAGKHSTQYEPK